MNLVDLHYHDPISTPGRHGANDPGKIEGREMCGLRAERDSVDSAVVPGATENGEGKMETRQDIGNGHDHNGT